jgi:predicted porin
LNTDTFAGFKGHALLVLNNTNTSEIVSAAGVPTSGGNVNNNGWGLGVDYTWQKLFATASYQALKQNTTAANTSTPTSLAASAGVNAAQSQVFSNSSGTGIALCTPTITAANAALTNYSCGNQGLNIQDNQGYVGATYDFGILKAYASWLTRKASDTQNSGVYQKRQAEEIGVRSYITPTIESWASASIGTFTPMGYNQNSVHMNAWQLGSNYYLSKRTNLYAIYGQYAQANGTYNTYSSTGTAAGTFNTNMNVNSYAVGVRHTF